MKFVFIHNFETDTGKADMVNYRGLARPFKDMIQTIIKTWQGDDFEPAQKKK